MKLRTILSLLVALVALPAFAQTCPTAPALPIARDAVKLSWVAPTMAGASPLVGTLTYTVYEQTSATAWTARCTTAATSAGQAGLAVGTHTWAITAKTPTQGESLRSAAASKDIAAPTVDAPTSLKVEGEIVITGSITFTIAPEQLVGRAQ